ncbi:alpha/beta hydrolase [Longimicrobium sp.]|uniref:alpha/beta fold hydrolase n=1 Tax=Longimicrobium sp. TaxID=2029185 RepID=UPI002E30BF06|nr:alpha/beta hydrolase [Longimicrobium sp.]HEX6037676.1 alpha/beta hydrolase [Longimicrobium sp.]
MTEPLLPRAMPRVVFLGGNGHATARLGPARRVLAELAGPGGTPPFALHDVPYPGFEGRPRAASLDAFLDAVAKSVRAETGTRDDAGRPLVYATGIGGLLALCLRARGELAGVPLLLQAPVLWGLERRLMPRVLRMRPAQAALRRAFVSPRFQARFARKHFRRPLDGEMRARFFEGYARCAALPDFFAWLTPALLRRLEADFRARPEALDHVAVWWGERDTVVPGRELAWTEAALGVSWPVRRIPAWGHYPMMDDPPGWVRALADAVENTAVEDAAVETASRLSEPGRPQAR